MIKKERNQEENNLKEKKNLKQHMEQFFINVSIFISNFEILKFNIFTLTESLI